MTWTAPDNGGSAITKYTVTPYVGSTAQTPKDVTGSPAPTSTTISGLTNGTAYTFKVSATNAVGTSAQSAASNAVTPVTAPPTTLAFVQQVNKRGVAASLALQPTANISSGNRLIVEAGVWSAGNASASGVTDSAGNTYTKLTSLKASDNTELSVWSAPITAGCGHQAHHHGHDHRQRGHRRHRPRVLRACRPPAGRASSTCSRRRPARRRRRPPSPRARPRPATAAGELAMGFYADSGFGNTLAGDPGYSVRTNVSPTNDMELLVQDRVLSTAGTTASPTTGDRREHAVAGRHHRLQDLGARGAEPAQHAQRRHGLAGQRAGDRELDRARRRREPDHEVHRHALRRHDRPDADRRHRATRRRRPTTVTGLVNNTTYTFTVSATNANGTSPPSVASNPVTPASSPAGQWSALMNWPMVAVHSVLLKNGNLLIWDGWQNPEPTAVWNATSQTFPTTINAPGSIFCSGNVHLPDGRILTAGGDGIFTTGQPRPGRHDDLRSRRRGRGSASPT